MHFFDLALCAALALGAVEYVQPQTSFDGYNYRDPNGYKVAFTPSNLGEEMKKGLKPYNPVCTLDTPDGEITVAESKGFAPKGNWGCLVKSNAATKSYLVRVVSYNAEPKLEDDMDWAFYYVIKPGESILANPGKGSNKIRCRLCGAREYTGPSTKEDLEKFQNLEKYAANFQCRRECQAVIYKHRNFNAWSRTVSSNEAKLKQFEGITTLKVMGDGCVVTFYSEEDYKGSPVCEFKNSGEGATVWDQDAMATRCFNPSACPMGHDCAKSMSITMDKRCLPLASGQKEPPLCIKGKTCDDTGLNDLVETSVETAHYDKAMALKRLFKAMSEVLEE